MAERRAESGMPGDEARVRVLGLINRTFDLLEHGISHIHPSNE